MTIMANHRPFSVIYCKYMFSNFDRDNNTCPWTILVLWRLRISKYLQVLLWGKY